MHGLCVLCCDCTWLFIVSMSGSGAGGGGATPASLTQLSTTTALGTQSQTTMMDTTGSGSGSGGGSGGRSVNSIAEWVNDQHCKCKTTSPCTAPSCQCVSLGKSCSPACHGEQKSKYCCRSSPKEWTHWVEQNPEKAPKVVQNGQAPAEFLNETERQNSAPARRTLCFVGCLGVQTCGHMR